jgi:putative nucleotidyltransferase with HDIG domain
MRFLLGSRRVPGRRRQHATRVVPSDVSRRFARFLPQRENRVWWLTGVAAALLLSFAALPATFERRILDQAATERAREIARRNTPPIYTLDTSELTRARELFRRIQDVLEIPALTPEERAEALTRFPLTGYYLGDVSIPALLEQADRFALLRNQTLRILEQLLPRGIVVGGYGEGSFRAELSAYFDPRYTTQWQDVESMSLRVLPDRRYQVSDTLDWEGAIQEMQRLVRTVPLSATLDPETATAVRGLLQRLCRPFIRPNLFFNPDATARAQERNAAAVEPIQRPLHERPLSVWAGTLLLVALLGVLGGLFFASYVRYPTRDYRPVLALGVILLGATVLLYFGTRFDLRTKGVEYPVLVAPVATAAALSSILIGLQFGVFSTLFLTLVATLMGGMEASSAVPQVWVLLGSGLAATFTMAEVHHRRDIVVSGLYVCIAATLLTFGVMLLQGRTLGWELASAAVAGLVVAAVVPGLLQPLESLSGTATDMELLELADMNHPLLLQLQKVAPGTFNHSLNVSRLAEAAAEAIGANTLLARVGAYYHDIGKINYAQYFIENQEGGPNPHDRLSPTMSARVLIAHVKEGIELAREHRLPRAIVDLIPHHHGTSLMRVFYAKAAEHGDLVQEAEFRYPGPKPQSKVGAIMMLADSIEAAATAEFKRLSALSHRDCETLVSDVMNRYVLDGQLGECDLTLNDLRLLSASFQRTLLAMYHSRVEYPKGPEPSAGRIPPEHGAAV